MSRYRGPKLRISRRFGKNVILPGLTTKVSKKTQPPGKPKPKDDSENKNQKPTEYGIRLNEKQKLLMLGKNLLSISILMCMIVVWFNATAI